MNLQQFSDTDAIAVRETEPVRSPIDGSILGFTGPSNRDGQCVVCQEYRWPKEDGQQNFYRKLGGYTFNEVDIQRLKEAGVKRVIIREMDNSRVLEFELSQFINGDDGGFVNGRQKLGVPVDRALFEWDEEETAIVSANGRGS